MDVIGASFIILASQEVDSMASVLVRHGELAGGESLPAFSGEKRPV